jgi:A/G-specific adenine glycosylase
MPTRTPPFASRIVAWQRRHGRHDLPWQQSRDPYRIWVAEIMLQQTQVAAVLGYYGRFIARLPDIAALAAAPADEVMRLWSGLGYYARARNLHAAAKLIVARHGGRFPLDFEAAQALPGIGRSTAAAILAFATGKPHAILDGNVKRVLARHFAVAGAIDSAATLRQLWDLARSLVPSRDVERYTQGMMDLGATVCTRSRPACNYCPVRGTCSALRDMRVDEFPGRKSKRESPTRSIAMLAVVSAGEVLVERRPSPGIWGGLWSLPEGPADLDPAAWVRERLGLRVLEAEQLMPFTHAFTHFNLAVTPWRLRVRANRARVVRRDAMWLPLQEARSAALPAPVKRLLESLAR